MAVSFFGKENQAGKRGVKGAWGRMGLAEGGCASGAPDLTVPLLAAKVGITSNV